MNTPLETLIAAIDDYCDAACDAGVGTNKIGFAEGLIAKAKKDHLRKLLEDALRQQSQEPDDGISRVYQICNRYESGYGHGLKRDGLDLSKTPHADPEMGEAYQIGYEAGSEKFTSPPAPPQARELWCGSLENWWNQASDEAKKKAYAQNIAADDWKAKRIRELEDELADRAIRLAPDKPMRGKDFWITASQKENNHG